LPRVLGTPLRIASHLEAPRHFLNARSKGRLLQIGGLFIWVNDMAKRSGGPRTINVVGANLFCLAAQYLGDTTQWNRIAAINDLWDPVLPLGTPMTLKIPPVDSSAGNGGILGI
jgi:hypothetical protein